MQTVFYAVGKEKAVKVGDAWINGCGGRRAKNLRLLEDGLPVFYGVTPETIEAWNAVRACGRDFLYIDNAYFGRGDYYRVTWNAMQHSGAGASDGERFKALAVPILPWKNAEQRKNGHVLVATQSEWWYLRHGTTILQWVREIERAIRAVSAREIRVRVKPEGALLTMSEAESPLIAAGIKRATPRPGPPFAADLEGAWALVAHSSNTTLEAAFAGIPAFVTSLCAGAALGNVDLARIENPVIAPDPARQHLGEVLADNQWRLSEMRAGKCWSDLTRSAPESWFAA